MTTTSAMRIGMAVTPLLVAALGVLTYVRPLKLGLRGRAALTLLFFALASRGLFFQVFGGSRFAPELPELVVWIVSAASTALGVLVALSLVWRTPRGRAFLLPAVAVAITVWGMFDALRPPSVKEVELDFANLPADLDGYRVLQISDLHCSSATRAWRTRAVVDRANAANADLVCLTGDYVDGRVAYLSDDMKPLRDLKAKDGVWCVTGNHEHYQDSANWAAWFRENGLRFLDNESVRVRPGLTLAGVRDMGRSVQTALRGTDPGDFRILLEHRPIRFRANVRRFGVDLQLSGHTHGGIAPLVDRLIARLNGGFVRGLYREGASRLYVNPGSGLWMGFPLRYFNPSEITVFVLRRK